MATADLTELEGLLGRLGLDTPIPEFPTADVLVKPTDIFRCYLASLLSPALGREASAIYDAIHSTADIALGDLVVILPRLKLSAEELERLPLDLKTKLPASPLFTAPFIDGVHLRLFFSAKALPSLLLPYISSRTSQYGQELSRGLRDPASPEQGRKKVVVEFSSPNVASDFEDRHLRSTILGEFIANSYERRGWNVVRLNYLGDFGKQIALLAAGWERFWSEESLKEDQVRHLLEVNNKIKELFRPEEEARQKAKDAGESTTEIESQGLFAERDALFKKMEDCDEAALALSRQFRDIAVGDLTSTYARMGIKFDDYSGESQVKHETIIEAKAILRDKGLLEESDGAWIVDIFKHSGKKGLGTAMIRQRSGSTTYLLRDIAAVLDRERAYEFDRMLYVVTAKQENHFRQLFTVLDLMGRSDLTQKLEHVSFGKIQDLCVHMNDAHLLSDILDRTASLMRQAMAAEQREGVDGDETTAVGDFAAVSALIAQDMSGRRGHGYAFDPKRMASSDAGTGLRLQAGLAEVTAAIAELRTEHVESAEADFGSLENEDAADLLRLMLQYPDVTASAFASLEPHTILSYLFRLDGALSVCLAQPEGSGEEAGPATEPEETSVEEKKARLALYENARQILENGMRILGFPMLSTS